MLDRESTVLIVIDFQERMMPHIEGGKEVIKNAIKLIKSAKIFELPIIVTKQKKLGEIISEIKKEIGYEAIEKITFSCWRNEKFIQKLEETERKKCLVMGIETHICVLQTSLDLFANGYEVHVAFDCTGSRKMEDKRIAEQRMTAEGVKPTSAEIAIYELLKSADVQEFKKILNIIKE